MRVLVAGTFGLRNGIETYTRHLVTGLEGAGHEVFTVDRSEHGAAGSGGVRLSPRLWPLWRAVGPFESTRVHRRLRSEVRRLKPDVVHVTYPEFAAGALGPLVITAWHPETGVLRRAASARGRGEKAREAALFAGSDRRALRRADAVIATSRAVERAVTIRRARVEYVPPFLPDDAIVRTPTRRDRTCLMVAGTLDDPRKGLDVAIAAVDRLRASEPSLRLVLVGGWRSTAARTRLPPFCDVRGVLTPDSVRAEMGRAGCLLVSSRWEEFGYAALEALAAGTPVACAPLTGFEGIESDGLIRAAGRDPAQISDAARRALDTTSISYPEACLGSVAIAAIGRVYDAVSR